MVGRSRTCDLVLPGEEPPVSSGRHAEIKFAGGSWWVEDLDSTNGTLINGTPHERCRLRPGDRLGFGGEPLLEWIPSDGSPPGPRWLPFAIGLGVAAVALVLALLLRPPAAAVGFAPVAEVLTDAVYLLVLDGSGERSVVGTAFAVSQDGVLATAAHVAAALEPAFARTTEHGGVTPTRAIAVRSDSYEEYPILRCRLHPDFQKGSFRGDVGLVSVELEGRPELPVVALASEADIAELKRGLDVATLGFPAIGTEVSSPRARLRVDVIGDVVRDRYLGIGLDVVPGTSGSPVFTRDGRVIGVIVGGNFDKEPAGDVNWAVSATLLREMLGASTE